MATRTIRDLLAVCNVKMKVVFAAVLSSVGYRTKKPTGETRVTAQEDAELFDMQDYPNVHAAGIADLYCLNDGRGRLVFFDWFKVDGLWIKKVVGTVTRPCKSMVQEQPMVVDKLMQIAQSASTTAKESAKY